VTVDIPLATLNQVDAAEFGWQVPGLRLELVTELIRSLPKQLRTAFVPVPDTARAVLRRLGPAHGDLLAVLGAELTRLGGVQIPREAWDLSALPAHLRITFRVVEQDGVLAAGKDLDALRRELLEGQIHITEEELVDTRYLKRQKAWPAVPEREVVQTG